MKHVAVFAFALFLLAASPADAVVGGPKGDANIGQHDVSTDVNTQTTEGPSSPDPQKPPASASAPMVNYVTYELTQDRAANTGDLNGLCFAGNDPTKPGFQYELVGTDAKGTIVERRSVCVAFEQPGVTPPPPPLPQVPTFAEAWNAAQLPAPVIVTDPATRGITGLETRISTAGETTKPVAAEIRGYRMTATAHIDHYTISVDGGPAVTADHDRYTFETKGDHTITIGAVWRGEATLTGPDLIVPIHLDDIGTTTLTVTRTYPVHEIRSVLQP